jgi:predicted transcriptional regulator
MIRKVLRESPISLRALAQEAGVSHVALIKIRDGEFEASAEIQKAVLKALRKQEATLRRLADQLEREVK